MKKRALLLVLTVAFVLLGIWLYQDNVTIVTTRHEISHAKIPTAFDGFTIAHLSDLHNATFGAEQHKLLKVLADTQPNIVVVTGDLIDSRRTDVEIATSTLDLITQIAPVYYVTGNHEFYASEAYAILESHLLQSGVHVLHDEVELLHKNGQSLQLIGLDDPAFDTAESSTLKKLSALISPSDFSIVLSHRPERFDAYCAAGANLVFSGHAHGGQFRLPFIGGLYAPNQGIFPAYTQGTYTAGDTTLVVSRGLGNSIFPVRFNNPPEVVIVTLKA